MTQRITLQEFRDYVQGSVGEIVDGFIPIIDGQFLTINPGTGGRRTTWSTPMTFELWSPEDMTEYLNS
jgi:hypothetical protein